MGMAPQGGRGIKADINVTPLVDVVLVLLIIFMVITPMLQRGKPVKLPKAAQVEKENLDTDPLVVTITAAGAIYLEQDSTDEPQLEQQLRGKLTVTPDKKILVKGDEGLSCGAVRRVLGIIKKAGAKGASLGVEEAK